MNQLNGCKAIKGFNKGWLACQSATVLPAIVACIARSMESKARLNRAAPPLAKDDCASDG
ncbi:hypothetical protein [Chromobacterium haemolyticum]|uniref:hypothetical protein n=1 Tax=Chromobacterium haemolyticum TaxID=394935 RepID=UPI001F074898|nr:hypothetical protein [Chromobacterium haemolyticum]